MATAEISTKNLSKQIATKVVAIAASKGGIKALEQILSELPADFSGSIIVVQHLSRQRVVK